MLKTTEAAVVSRVTLREAQVLEISLEENQELRVLRYGLPPATESS